MIDIKVTLQGYDKDSSISEFVGNENNEFNDCRFWINKDIENPDIWFVFENIIEEHEECRIDPKNIIFLSAETSYNKDHFLKTPRTNFLKQFGKIYSCYDSKIPTFKDIPFLPWMINANHGDSIYSKSERDLNYFLSLKEIKKTKTLSVFCSDKNFTEGHRKRLDFVYGLKDHFGEDLDWYGNGINQLDTKWDGIAPYKYHISLENKNMDYVISEKLFDSYLGLSFPFYSGAPNVNDYFPSNSLRKIDINNLDKSIEIIEECIENNLYENNSNEILYSKNLICTELNLFYRLSSIAKINIQKNKSIKKTRIKNLNKFESSFEKKENSLKKIYSFLRRIKQILLKK